MTAKTTSQTIALARKHAVECVMRGSALLCLADAERLFEAGLIRDAHRRALDSMRYSVGVFHPDFQDGLAGFIN